MDKIWEEAAELQEELVARRRDLHQYPETGWTEFRTASMVIQTLRHLGYQVAFGPEVLAEEAMLGVPDADTLAAAAARAIDEGADAALVEAMKGGKTGIVATISGNGPGRTVAFRFDMDCNDVAETAASQHLPNRLNFASRHPNSMHACGHDGHVAIGLGLAKLLAGHQQELVGQVKLIFQPAEEGVRGAYAMVQQGVVDDVDYFFGGHIGFKAKENASLVCTTEGFLATTKLDALYTGVASHAGLAPEEGRNALLAAAQACLALHGIPRHGKGSSRINVGVLHGGTGRNVVPDRACLKLETRGATTEINNYMVQQAQRILEASAAMYEVQLQLDKVGSAPGCQGDVALGQEITNLAAASAAYEQLVPTMDMGGSEDCAYFMERVQQLGGRALYMMYGSELAAGHHQSNFDFDEDTLWRTVGLLTKLALKYVHN